jgi:nucleoside-diphosphate-sugar epimerase
VSVLAALTGRRPDVIYNQQQGGGLRRLAADLEVARRLLGYRPRVSVREGLQRLAQDERRLAAQRFSTKGDSAG